MDASESDGYSNAGIVKFVKICFAVCYIVPAMVVAVTATIGFYLSQRQELDPNSSFGLRTKLTMSSAAGWYASQRVAFEWLFYGGAVVLFLGIILMVVAVAKRWGMLRIIAITIVPWVAVGCVMAVGMWRGESAAREMIAHVNSSSR